MVPTVPNTGNEDAPSSAATSDAEPVSVPVDHDDRRRRMRRLDAWLDELDEQHGPPTPREIAEAVEWLAAASEEHPRD